MSPPPRIIDRFEVVRELGRGGMGVVFEVRDAELGRSLALKLMLQGLADPESLLRFAQESQLLARVSHPNVVRIHGVGRAPEGPYLVTERVEGASLDRCMRDGPFEPERAAAVVRDLCSAVAALHTVGILHRDLKPENVILRDDERPVLIDFGLAKDERADRLTQTGTVLGTPHYMSPEQASGDTHRLGPACDVYGLGATLFALLAGEPPFTGLPKVGLFVSIRSLEPAWPEGVQSTIPPPLQAICRHAMAKDPEQRPDVTELQRELDRFLAGELTPPASRSHSRFVLAVVTGACALLLLAAIYGLTAGQVRKPAPRSPVPPTNASVTSARGVEPTAADVLRAERRLRDTPSADALRVARQLLEGPGGSERVKLRLAYVKARLEGAPLLVSRETQERDLPALGKARWFDDQRLVVCSHNVRALWRWNDCRRDEWERFDYSDQGRIDRNSAPTVFGSRVFIGGGDAASRAALCYPTWEASRPTVTYPTSSQVSSIAAGVVKGRALLAVGTQSGLRDDLGTIVIFDLESGERLRELRGHRRGMDENLAVLPAEVRALAFLDDGRWLVSGGLAGDVIVWDVASWKPHKNKALRNGQIREFALHPRESSIAVADAGIRVLRVPGLEEVLRLEPPKVGVSKGVSFSRDGRLVFAISRRAIERSPGVSEVRAGTLLAHDLTLDHRIETVSFDDEAPHSIAVSPDGRRLVTYSTGPGYEGILRVREIDVPPSE